MERRLAAILAADVVGYSRLMGRDEEETLARLKGARLLIDGAVQGRQGRVFGSAGDSVVAEFASPVEALRCALEIQSQSDRTNASLPEASRMRWRIGLHLGDVMAEDGNLLGDGVNIAARLEALGEPGGICLSGSFHEQVVGKVDVAFEDLGRRDLKNIARPVQVYRAHIKDPGGGADPGPALPDKPSIAVLAFTNMSGDPEQDYFSDGISEDIITELSRLSGLFVIARNSSFSYRGQSLDLRQVGRELGVRYILEGSIRRSGKRVRITAQLIESESGSHVWAERYDRDLEDIFELQDEITRSVVGAIAPQIETAEIERTSKVRPSELSAYDLSLQSLAIFYEAIRSGDSELHQKALDRAQDALRSDPRSSHGLWVQAFAQAVQYLYRWGSDPDLALERAWATVERLLKVNAADERGLTVRALIQHFRGDFDAAIADFRRAFELNPNFVFNLCHMAWSESLVGLTEEAKAHAHLALRLSPRGSDFWLGDCYLALMEASFAEGDFEGTKKWGELAIQMTPNAPIRRALMIACYGHLGEPEKAKVHLDRLNAFAPEFIKGVLSGDLALYKLPEHRALMVEGLVKANQVIGGAS